MLERIEKVSLPVSVRDRRVNMMPIIAGDPKSIPEDLRDFAPIVDACGLPAGDTVYLTVHESTDLRNKSQRRPGVHVEAPRGLNWGGGWGGSGGVFMTSTDGACEAWDLEQPDRDDHGRVEWPEIPGQRLEVSTLYRVSDLTPHAALASEGPRTFFRLVSRHVGIWWARHNTPNPLGVMPGCRILQGSKF